MYNFSLALDIFNIITKAFKMLLIFPHVFLYTTTCVLLWECVLPDADL